MRKKQNSFSKARKSLRLGDRGRPSKIVENKTDIVSFLQQPNVSYCAPGRIDTIYSSRVFFPSISYYCYSVVKAQSSMSFKTQSSIFYRFNNLYSIAIVKVLFLIHYSL